MKTCKKCGEEKPRTQFSRNRTTGDGLQYRCKACDAEWRKEFRRTNPEWWRKYDRNYKGENRQRIRDKARKRYQADPEGARKALAAKVRRHFALTLEEYDALVSQPCALCGSRDKVVLDHDHTTGVLRGPLCNLCNTGIGKLGDDPARLRAAADYIESHR